MDGALGPALIEIFCLYLVFYFVLRFLQGTRGAGVLRGLVFFVMMALILVLLFVDSLGLYRIEFLMQSEALLLILLPIVVVFQPEIRRILLRLGEAPLLTRFFRSEDPIVPEIVDAAYSLANRKIGALITIEREVGLGAFVEAGTDLDSHASSHLLVTIFWPGSPLHDGAVIIRGSRVAAAGCVFPLTEQPGIARTLGTRHRAAIGVTEESDAISVVVSEETEQVSVAYRGHLRMGLKPGELRAFLEETLLETTPSPSPAGGKS
jgi:diadenylate cyclase